VETNGRRELLEHLKRGDAVLVDVRPSEEYAAGHIDGPRSIPLDELERRLAGPPADGEVLVYCRGPFCAVAHEAVRTSNAPDAQPAASSKAGLNGSSERDGTTSAPGKKANAT